MGTWILVSVVVLAGCAASGPRAGGSDRPALELYVARGGGSFARYRVSADGILEFGGGVDAIRGEWSWSGPLTEEERTRLDAIVTGWATARPVGTGDGAYPRYTVRVDEPGRRLRFAVEGEDASLAEARTLLDTAASRRFAGELDRLPKPSTPD